MPPEYATAYGPIDDGGFLIPAIDLRRMDVRYLRRQVAYNGPEAPGTIIIDTPTRYAYLIQPGGTAMRYGVGIGRDGFAGKAAPACSSSANGRAGRPPTR